MQANRTALMCTALAAAVVALLTVVSGASGKETGRPVIGAPVTVPARPMAGKPFALRFRVTDSTTRKAVTSGTMICDPSVAGRVLAHTESFSAGTARLGFVVPTTAAGKTLKVKVTIVSGGRSSTRVSTFTVTSTAPPGISIADATVAEANSGTSTLSFAVTLTAASGAPVTVAYATSDGTATAPQDYVPGSGSITFPAGKTTATVNVSVVGDQAIEPDETMTVTLSNPVGAWILKPTAVGTITNDDTAVPVTVGSYKGATQNGNYVFFTVTGARTVTGFRINSLPETCSPYGEVTGSVDWTKNTFSIRTDGSFRATGSWTGSDVDGDVVWTARSAELNGKIEGGSASGTVIVKDELTYKGTHMTCSSGIVTWTATVQ